MKRYNAATIRTASFMPAISFEFYPPKTDEQRAQLDRTADKLETYAPH